MDVADRWARLDPDRPAIIDVLDRGVKTTSFGLLRAQSNRLAAALQRLGVRRGDRVAVFLPQTAEVVVAHVAIYKLGAVALPLAAVFGNDALAHRMTDSGASVALSDAVGAARLIGLDPRPATLRTIVSIDGADGGVLDYHRLLAAEGPDFEPAVTSGDAPALMIYTSGTTGLPKGALHAHRVLPGHVPGFWFSHDPWPLAGDLMWTPADWAWAGGLLNAVLPALRDGVTVVARRRDSFDPDAAIGLLADFQIRNAFMPPTALRMLRAHLSAPPRGLALRSLTSAGEALGEETRAWTFETLGVEPNDVYGQTECNYVLGSCRSLLIRKEGAIGRSLPGHAVAILRPDGTACGEDEVGEIAIRRPDPAMFLGYWNQPDATARKFIGPWMITGDQAAMDREGYVSFKGRTDDLITSSGFRIGPVEIEECLLRHPAVIGAAAVGKPDPIRTEIVKAFVVLRAGIAPSAALAQDIHAFVRQRLSAHEYPREIAFVDALPSTPTGKVMRRLLREQA